MHPELLNNSTFLRYYNRWLEKPDSVVFASVAEYLLQYNHLDEAIRVCREGLKHMPNSVSGHMALAKVLIKRGKMEEADEELRNVLRVIPSHTKAIRLRSEIQIAGESGGEVELEEEEEEEEITSDYPLKEDAPAWQTVTMAKIYASQGHHEKAKEICRAILARDPSNEAAREELGSLGGTSS